MGLQELKIPREEYHLWEETIDESGEKMKRSAVIMCVNNHFDSCAYSIKGKYTLDDWRFLKKLAERILEIEEQPAKK